jgi:hypothetical protein
MDVVYIRELSDESFKIRFGAVPDRIAVEAMSEVRAPQGCRHGF